MKRDKEITVKILPAGSKEDCICALAEARQFVFKKLIGKKVRRQKGEDRCRR